MLDARDVRLTASQSRAVTFDAVELTRSTMRTTAEAIGHSYSDSASNVGCMVSPSADDLRALAARDHAVPSVPAPGGVARSGGRRTARVVSRSGLLGEADPGLRRSAGPAADRRAGAGGARREPNGTRASPAIDRATSSSRRCTAPATRTSRRRSTRADGLEFARLPSSRPRCGARRRTNRPTPAERDECRPYLVRELQLLRDVRVIVALGGFAYEATLGRAARRGRGAAVAASTVRPRARGRSRRSIS